MSLSLKNFRFMKGNGQANLSNIYIYGGSFSIAAFQGAVAGFNVGGNDNGVFPYPPLNVIDKFPFATDANATDVGDLTQARFDVSGQSSTTHGYSSGGYSGGTVVRNTIDRFLFSSNGNAVDVGDLTSLRFMTTGQSSETNGYVSGGNINRVDSVNNIDRFPFATNANASDVGDLTDRRQEPAGQSSSSHGYTSGGYYTPPGGGAITRNTIDRFPFATNTNASDVSDLTLARSRASGQSSLVSGYVSTGRGDAFGTLYNTIDKFPFASNANATDVGDYIADNGILEFSAGQSSTVSGYISGGQGSATGINVINKFSFTSDANSTDVGDLTVGRRRIAGQQD